MAFQVTLEKRKRIHLLAKKPVNQWRFRRNRKKIQKIGKTKKNPRHNLKTCQIPKILPDKWQFVVLFFNLGFSAYFSNCDNFPFASFLLSIPHKKQKTNPLPECPELMECFHATGTASNCLPKLIEKLFMSQHFPNKLE